MWDMSGAVTSTRIFLGDDDSSIINLPVNKWWELRKDFNLFDGKEVFLITLLLENGKAEYNYSSKKIRDAAYDSIKNNLKGW